MSVDRFDRPRWQALRGALAGPHLLSEPTEEAYERVSAYLELRATWGRVHNLGGPRALSDPRDDLLDTLCLGALLNQSLPLIDIGSGGGVPGLLLACLYPAQEITLVEPAAKRCAFLQHVAHSLSLSHVRVQRARWPHPPLAEGAPAQLVSRAVLSPLRWPAFAASTAAAEIFQYLAAERPPWPLEGYVLAGEIDYRSPTGGERLLRRWRRED